MRSYDDIGSVYDQGPHVEVADGFFQAIRPTLAAFRKEGATVLDLGCGTGLVTARIAAAGCRVVGIDSSEEMLRGARGRCRRFGRAARFVRDDLRTFSLARPAAAAFSCADVVNHFPSERPIAQWFRRTREALRPGGIFVFDALDRYCFETYWTDKTYYFTAEAGDLVMECSWDPKQRLGTCRMNVYARTGRDGFRKTCWVLRERLYDERTLRRLLREAGFSKVEVRPWSPWKDQHLEPALDRTLWTATR